MAARRPAGVFGKEPWNGVPSGRWATELSGSLGRNQSLSAHAPPACAPTYKPVQLYAGAGGGGGALTGISAASATPQVAASANTASIMRFIAWLRPKIIPS